MFGILKQKRGEISTVVTIAVAILVFAIVFPIAMQSVISANTTGWNSAVATIFTTLVPVLGALAIALLFIKKISGR